MSWIRNAWNKFKAQPEIWFFYAFLATSMLSVRKVLADYFLAGAFNEYTGTYLYLSDLFLAVMLVVWSISILYNKNLILSIKSFRDVLRGTSFYLLIAPLLLVIWSFTSISWANNGQIALYRSFKLFEFYLLYLFLALRVSCPTPVRVFHASTNVPRPPRLAETARRREAGGTSYGAGVEQSTGQAWIILRNTFHIIIGIGLINAIIGILQVILQHSIGLFWLKESLISPALPGVAKVILGGVKYVRAYGLFPHPNILAGFLLLSIILTLAYYQIFTLPKHLPRSPIGSKMFHMEHFTLLRSGGLFALTLGIQIVGGILTFSKSAFLGFILVFIYLARNYIVPRGTRILFPWQLLKLAKTIGPKNRKNSSFTKKWLVFLIISLVLVVLIINPDFKALFIQPLSERLDLLLIAQEAIFNNFLAGVGSGQFVIEMQKYSNQALSVWQFQPVHNVFLLIFSELGLFGFFAFVIFLWKLFHPERNVSRPPRLAANALRREAGGTSYGASVKQEQVALDNKNVPCGTFGSEASVQSVFKALLIGFFVIALFDHYLWDIQQGQIMLWMVLGFLARTSIYNNLTK